MINNYNRDGTQGRALDTSSELAWRTNRERGKQQATSIAERKGVISWPISVIVDAHLQLKHAKRDKLEGNDDDGSK